MSSLKWSVSLANYHAKPNPTYEGSVHLRCLGDARKLEIKFRISWSDDCTTSSVSIQPDSPKQLTLEPEETGEAESILSEILWGLVVYAQEGGAMMFGFSPKEFDRDISDFGLLQQLA